MDHRRALCIGKEQRDGRDEQLGAKFVRWGMGLSIVGLIAGYVPLGHYLMMGAIPSCPAAPVHGHAILLSFVGMTMFGLAYRALPAWMGPSEPPVGLVRMHFWLAVAGVLGVAIQRHHRL